MLGFVLLKYLISSMNVSVKEKGDTQKKKKDEKKKQKELEKKQV